MTTSRPGSLTDVGGVLVGHDHRLDPAATLGSGAATGCTVVRLPGGATASVDVRGGGPGTRETDLLEPANTVQQVDAILLTGGSAYGLAAADGVMRRLEEEGAGIPMGEPGRVVPIVPAAVIFDLPVGDWSVRPDAEAGYRAAAAAGPHPARGTVGAGVGARAGVLKGGVGMASIRLTGGTAAGMTVAALVVANPVGAVFDPTTGLPWSGAAQVGLRAPDPTELAAANDLPVKGTVLNTTIGVVATDAPLSAAGCRRLAVVSHDGLARAIRPAHSPLDGDTMFAVATGRRPVPTPGLPVPPAFPVELPMLTQLCAVVADVVERAVVDAVVAATGLSGVPAYRDVLPSAFPSGAPADPE
ncbi:P1 family peptidase [Skermania piniformis]|uniref:P1 family peptidase n=1 Tax=Skermania pinensis TaxID=39122 RepID=A0ABX8SA95_9ACTN|nr:P1 family peptidase [Skermania piniformis]QXQ14783.1 P1 family peptidase [Skermania piniformis]